MFESISVMDYIYFMGAYMASIWICWMMDKKYKHDNKTTYLEALTNLKAVPVFFAVILIMWALKNG